MSADEVGGASKNVQVVWSRSMQNAIRLNGQLVIDALGDPQPVKRDHSVGNVVVQTKTVRQVGSGVEDRLHIAQPVCW